MRNPQFGEQRIDVYFQAAEDIPAGRVLSHVRRSLYGVKLARSKRLPIAGASLTSAKRGDGLWVRVQGAADVKVEG